MRFKNFFRDRKNQNVIFFLFFTAIVVVITIASFLYMEYITPKLEVKGNILAFQKNSASNLANVMSTVETVKKKNIKKIKVEKNEIIKISSAKLKALEPEVVKGQYVTVPVFVNMQEEELETARLEYVPASKKEGYFFKMRTPSKEGTYTYQINLNYRNIEYIFILNLEVK